jgi:acetyltransferase-like isoleucine patch superfamily enzyme
MHRISRLDPKSEEDQSHLQRLNISISGNRDNYIYVNKNDHRPGQYQVKIECSPNSVGNEIHIGNIQKITSHIKINGNRNVVRIAESNQAININLHVAGSENLFEMGSNCSVNQARMLIDGHRNEITFGNDCMLSYGITIQNSDSHAIIDLNKKERINLEKDIQISSRVWVGANATILKGIRIGAGSIIGTCSVVTKDVPSTTLVAGIPARVIRRNVSWTRSANPSSAEIERLCKLVEDESSLLQPPF